MDVWDWIVTAIVLAVGYALGVATVLLFWPPQCDHDEAPGGGDDDL